ncbi:MAG TPA: TonB-dependent receptor [Anseongella sp.]
MTKLYYCKLLVLAFSMLLPALGKAQQQTVTGTVVSDETGEPLPGVSVTLKGDTRGTSTNADGNYSILVSSRNAILVFELLGFTPQGVNISGRSIINVTLMPDVRQLEEVVAIGYGTVRKSDLTGAVSSLKMEDIEGIPLNSIEQGIQGRIAGVQVTQSSAAPDGGISMIIRGSNSLVGGTEPLYVIDGIPISGGNEQIWGPDDGGGPAGEGQELSQAPNFLSFLNPDDIESIEVLKDASATAIYGSRASNGVVLITTKQGTVKPTISFNVTTEMVQPFRRWDLLSAEEYAEYRRLNTIVGEYMNGSTYEDIIESGLPHSGTYSASDGSYTPSPEDYAAGRAASTDWQDVIFRNALTQRYSLSLSGTANKLRYYIGGGYNNLQGPVINSSFDRYSLSSKLSGNAGTNVTFTNSLNAVRTVGKRVQADIAVSGANSGIMTKAYRSNPLTQIGQIWFEEIEGDLVGSDDPYTLATAFDDVNTTSQIMNNLQLDWEVIKNLHVKVSGAVRYTARQRDMYFPLSTQRGQLRGNGAAFYGNTESLYLINENLLTYRFRKEKHLLDVLGGFTMERTTRRSAAARTSNFLNDFTRYYNLGAGTDFTKPGTGFGQIDLTSFLSRLNYNYDNRYLLTASLRADGSSKFGKYNKWGYFPSAAFAWRVSNESFMSDIKSISDLKLRLSYGVTGNQGLSSYQSLPQLMPESYPFEDAVSIGYQNAIIENPNLRWERTTQYNVGLDIALFNGRIALTGEYYLKRTADLLQVVSLAPSTGYLKQVQNLGSLENKGMELEVNAKVLTGKLKWDVGAVWFKNDVEVLDLGGMDEYPGAWTVSWDWRPFPIKVGRPLGDIYGYRVDKVMKTQEDIANAANDLPTKNIGEFDFVKDEEGNMKLFRLGNTNPRFSLGFNSTFSYKAFELSFHLAGSIGQDIFNMQDRFLLYGDGAQTTRDYYNRFWIPEVKDASGNVVIPDNGGDLHMIAATGGRTSLSNLNAPIDLMIQDGSYVKLRNLQLAYTLPKKSTPAWMRRLRLYASVTNLFSFDNYSGLDPEASVYGQDPTRRGVAYGEYPMSRTFTFRADFRF